MARIDDTERVFDVSKPHKIGPNPTSKPVIVGHRPTMADPMVRDDDEFLSHSDKSRVSVPVMTDDKPEQSESSFPSFFTENDDKEEKPFEKEAAKPDEEPEKSDWDEVKNPETKDEHKYTSVESLIGDDEKEADKPKDNKEDDKGDSGGDSGGHLIGTLPLPNPKGAGPRRSKTMLWGVSFLLLLGAGAYLAIDAGAIGSGIKLPFEFFKEKPAVVQPVITTPPPAPVKKPALDANLTKYTVPETALSFAYPKVWGTATPTKDPGFSKRINTNVPAGNVSNSDGTYAYLVSFSDKKDVQVVVTSSKYLPLKWTAEYYDFLQWCVGTNDGNYYKELLRFTTAGGTDTATTTTCDQGPLAGVTKLDDKTIVEKQAKAADNKVLGDVYTKNLTNINGLAVIRVKDVPMTSGDDIKKLLTSVSVEPASP